MAIQYVDRNADVGASIAAPYNISGSNNQLSINVDGTGNQVFALTTGSTRTAEDIVADLAALTGATATVVNVNGSKYVRIRTTSANGPTSTILVNAPSNNVNSTLGILNTTYHGGTNVSYNFVGSTKQLIINNIETALNTAGWVTVSGSNTTNLLMRSPFTPDPQNLRIHVRVKDNGNNCAVVSIENVPGTKIGGNSTANGIQLLPAAARGYRVLANKYQVFIMSPGSVEPRTFGCLGVPYLPSFLCGKLYEAAWLQGNADGDTDTGGTNLLNCRPCFRVMLGVDYSYGFNGSTQTQNLCNGFLWEDQVVSTGANPALVHTQSSYAAQNGSQVKYWHDGSAIMSDPLICWGTTNITEGTIKGQLWDAFVSSDSYPVDIVLENIDSRKWQNITYNGIGNSNGIARGSLFVVTP